MRRSGHADLPLHHGRVPAWLAQRMTKLGGAMIEAIVQEYGKDEVLRRLSDPLWFQSFGAVLGMDWHSSGITTSVMGALKKALNPMSKELGIYVCGGRGKFSLQTPSELIQIADQTGMDGNHLVECSKLSAKVDNTAIQDGYQLYLHSFILSDEGKWSVVQQGLNDSNGYARRYHWHSEQIKAFLEEPHTSICGLNQGQILNLTDAQAQLTKNAILDLSKQPPVKTIQEARKIILPRHHEVRSSNVNLKRLGSILALAHEQQFQDFKSLLMFPGIGPRTIQSLTLVSEVIYGTPSRFSDPARFSFAHGGKDGHPFPVPLKIYDQTISVLKNSVEKAKIDQSDKKKAIQKLSQMSQKIEKDFKPNANFDQIVQNERDNSWKYGGRTVFGKAKPPMGTRPNGQLDLFN